MATYDALEVFSITILKVATNTIVYICTKFNSNIRIMAIMNNVHVHYSR